MCSCGCSCSCRCSSNPYLSAGGGILFFCLFFCVPACPRFIKHWCSSVLFPLCNFESSDFISLLSCDYLSVCVCVCVYVGLFAEVYLRFSRGCGGVPRSGGGSGWAPVPFVVYPPSCRGGWFHTTELFLRECSVVVVLCIPLMGHVVIWPRIFHFLLPSVCC